MRLSPTLCRYFILCIFMLGGYFVQGQTIGAATVTGTPVCAGSNVNISFEVTNGYYSWDRFTTNTTYQVYLATRINGTYSSTTTVIHTFTSSTAPYNYQYASAIINRTVPIPSNYATNSNYVIWVGSSTVNTVSPYDSAIFTINAAPPNPTASNNGPICVGGTLQLNASTISGATYRWTGPNGYTSTAQNPIRTNATAAMAGVYTVVATVNGCPSNPVSTTVGGSVANDSQTTAGNNSWIGHLYDGTNQGVAYNGNFLNYVGNYTEPVLFDQGFGGNTSCFSVGANSNPISISTETFSVRYRMNSTQKGLYSVSIGSDDGSRLSVDGNLVYNNWSDHGYAVDSNILVNLTGTSKLVLDYYENSGGNRISISSGTTAIIENRLTQNVSQSITIGNSGQVISGDTYETYAAALPSGISRTGTGYQWVYSTTPGGTRTMISGATGATFTPITSSGPFNTAGTYYIYRIATLSSANNKMSTTYLARNESNAAILTVEATGSVLITEQPQNQTICHGDTATFKVNATGSGLNYQWYINRGSSWDVIGNDGFFSGTSSATLTVSNWTRWQGTVQFRAVVSNSTSQATSSSATLVSNGLEWIPEATPKTICPGENTFFEVWYPGTAFQWQVSTDGGNNYTNITNNSVYSNTTSSRLTISNAPISFNGYLYRVRIYEGNCSEYSTPSTLTVDTGPVVTLQPSDQSISTGSNAYFQSSATGSAGYRWQVNNGYGWGDIWDSTTYSGTSTNQLTVHNVQAGLNNYSYRLRFTNSSGCTSVSDSAVLTLLGPCGAREDLDVNNENNSGTDSWIGHVYDETTLSPYIGYYSETEIFDQNFSGDAICFPMKAGGSVYTETFSVRYRMNSSRNGLYVVDMGSDDGSRLKVDGNLVYNNWVAQSYGVKPRVLIGLSGKSTLEFEYYEQGGGNRVSFNNLVQIIENELDGNINQNYCAGGTTAPITGDSFGTLPTGISLVGTGYQWTYSTSPEGVRTNITGATSATFTPNVFSAPFNVPGTYYIFRNVTLSSSNNTGVNPYVATHESNPAILEVNSQISNNEIIFRETGTVCATVNEGGTLSISAPEGTVFTSVDFASYGTPNGTCGNFTLGTCHATSSLAVVEAYLLGNNSATIPATNAIFGDPCSGIGKRLYVQATYAEPVNPVCSGEDPGTISGSTPESTGGEFTYSWEMSTTGPDAGFSEAPGRNELQDYNPGPLQQSAWFKRNILTENCEPYSSNVVEIPVNPLPTGTLSGPATVCQGEVIEFSGTLTGTGPWDVTIIANEVSYAFTFTNSTFTLFEDQEPQEYNTYSISKVTDANGCTNTDVSSITVRVLQDVASNTLTGDQALCGSGTPEALVGSNATGSSVAYLWESSIEGSTSGFIAAAGTNNAKDYTPELIAQTTWYRRIASNDCSTLTSNVIEVTVYPSVSGNNITLANGSNTLQSVCTGADLGTITGTVPTGGDGNFSYLWESSTTGPGSGFKPAMGTNNIQNYDPGVLTETTWFRRTAISPTCGDISSNVVEVAVNPLPTIEISGTNTICVGETTYLTGTISGTGPWTINGTMNGTPFSVPATTSTFSQALTPTVNTTIKITGIEDANGCVNNEVHSITITVLQENIWTGAQDTNWNNAANWSCSTIPTLEINVLIPSGLTNYPVVLSGDAGLANNLTIETGASIDIGVSWFGIAGATINQGIFNTENGTVVFASDSPQVISSGLFQNDLIENLLIWNTSEVTSEAFINVKGILQVLGGTFNTGDKLTLLSNNTKTALIDGAGTGHVIGEVKMQRYLDNTFGYKYFSSPFQNTTVGDFAPYINLNESFPNFYSYEEERKDINGNDATGWEIFTDSTALLNTIEGYALNFGDSIVEKTVEIGGTVNNGSYSRTLHNNNGEYTQGFNLVGNPYPSPIDWNATTGWTKTNVDDAIYFFTAGTTDRYTGTYTSYVNGIQSSDGKSSNIIPSMQGFFVHVSDITADDSPTIATLGMTNEVRINDFSQDFIKTPEKAKHSLIRLTAGYENEERHDPTVVYFVSNASQKFEKELDAHKLMNTAVNVPNFYSITPEKDKLAISAVSNSDANDPERIPLGIKAEKAGSMVITLKDVENLSSGAYLYLVDEEKRIVQNLNTNPNYRFQARKGENDSRFYLLFSSTRISDPAVIYNEPFSVETGNGQVLVRMNLNDGEKGPLQISTVTGQIINVLQVSEKEVVEIHGIRSTGVYFVSYLSGKEIFTKKVLVKK